MRSHWITHKGKKVFYVDFAKIEIDELKEEVKFVEKELCAMPKNSALSMADVRDSFGTNEAMEIIQGLTSKTKQHVRKRAVIGVTGVKKILLKALNQVTGQTSVPFDSLEEALDWLVKD
jgi:hypothetical protein